MGRGNETQLVVDDFFYNVAYIYWAPVTQNIKKRTQCIFQPSTSYIFHYYL